MNDETNEYEPTPELRLFVETLMSEEVRGNKERASRVCGVDKGKFYWAWNKHPEFRVWYKKFCEEQFQTGVAIGYAELLREMQRGDNKVQAIRTFFEVLGKIKQGAEININNVNNANYGEPTAEEEEFVRQQRETLGL